MNAMLARWPSDRACALLSAALAVALCACGGGDIVSAKEARGGPGDAAVPVDGSTVGGSTVDGSIVDGSIVDGSIHVGDSSPCPSPARMRGRGEATYYDVDDSGACSFGREAGSEILVAAMSSEDWDTADVCGMCVRVEGPKGAVVVKVVDRCPGCSSGDLDLSKDAFRSIARIADGRVSISWSEVPCPVVGGVVYHFKDGSNASWAALQLRNHRYRVASLAAKSAGRWIPLERKSYNYFVAQHGFGREPLALKATDSNGSVLEASGMVLDAGKSVESVHQFPMCSP
ncbi:MAG: hypothetical protein IPK13_08440 [Deltaproteobacteria bacterium]|nr:hypothetical protein [Deltaproteobacteria bacterium]